MLKHFAHQPNSKNNGPVLLLILGVELNCFLMSVATNGEERHGLKREEFAPPFQLQCYACTNHQKAIFVNAL